MRFDEYLSSLKDNFNPSEVNNYFNAYVAGYEHAIEILEKEFSGDKKQNKKRSVWKKSS